MTEDRTLDIKLPIAEWDDVERRMAIVARMTADRRYFKKSSENESPQDYITMRRIAR
ncbi:MAG: hypothetical protein ACXADS_02620 [Candidatus Thorarchaeota archaeon]